MMQNNQNATLYSKTKHTDLFIQCDFSSCLVRLNGGLRKNKKPNRGRSNLRLSTMCGAASERVLYLLRARGKTKKNGSIFLFTFSLQQIISSQLFIPPVNHLSWTEEMLQRDSCRRERVKQQPGCCWRTAPGSWQHTLAPAGQWDATPISAGTMSL